MCKLQRYCTLTDRSTAQEIYEDERKYVNFDLYDPEDTPFHRFTFNVSFRPVQ